MASIYNKSNKIYISWYDFTLQKRMNKSLNLDYNPKNWKQAQAIKKQFEDQLKKEKEKIKGLALKRIDIKDAFEHFLRNNSSKHHKTIKNYMRFYNKFVEAFQEEKPCSIITKMSVENWLNLIKKLPYKKNTIFDYYKQLNHFLNFLFEYNYIPMFKINRDVKPKVENVEKIVISLEDMALLFKMLKHEKKTDNFKCLLYLLYYTGLRATDLLTIDAANINIQQRELKFYSPKKKVFRTVGFHEDLIPILEQAIQEKQSGRILGYGKEEALQRAFSRYLHKLDIGDKHYSSRSFRKTFVTLARRNHMDESIVKELVGHTHESITDKFYNRIEIDQMIEELKKFPRVTDLPYDQITDRVKKLIS